MKFFKIILVFPCFLSCLNNYIVNAHAVYYTVSTGDNISINKTEIEAALNDVLRNTPGSPNSLEIVIYGYSSNKEIFSYSGDTDKTDNIKAEINPGRIDSLVKIKDGKILQKVVFLHVDGNDKEEILKKFALEIRGICK